MNHRVRSTHLGSSSSGGVGIRLALVHSQGSRNWPVGASLTAGV